MAPHCFDHPHDVRLLSVLPPCRFSHFYRTYSNSSLLMNGYIRYNSPNSPQGLRPVRQLHLPVGRPALDGVALPRAAAPRGTPRSARQGPCRYTVTPLHPLHRYTPRSARQGQHPLLLPLSPRAFPRVPRPSLNVTSVTSVTYRYIRYIRYTVTSVTSSSPPSFPEWRRQPL